MNDAEKAALEQRFPLAKPLHEARAKLEEARKHAEQMPVGIVKTRAGVLLREAERKLAELGRVLVRAEMFEANERSMQAAGIVLPKGVRHGRRQPD